MNEIGHDHRQLGEADRDVACCARWPDRTPTSTVWTTTAPAKQPAERAGRLAEARERAGQPASRSSTHSAWSTRSGCSSSRERPRGSAAPASRRSPPTPKPAHSMPGAEPVRAAMPRPGVSRRSPPSGPARAARARDRSARRSWPASSSRRPAPCRRSGSRRRRCCSGRKLLKNVATRNDEVSVLNGKATCCALQQQSPAPGAREHHRQIVAQQRRGSQAGEALRATRPQPRDVHPREQQPEQADADGRLQRGNAADCARVSAVGLSSASRLTC